MFALRYQGSPETFDLQVINAVHTLVTPNVSIYDFLLYKIMECDLLESIKLSIARDIESSDGQINLVDKISSYTAQMVTADMSTTTHQAANLTQAEPPS